MTRIIAAIGPPELRAGDGDPFHALARAIVFQQLSGKAAGTIFNRFLALLSGDVPAPAGARRTDPEWVPAVAPPRPEAVLGKSEEELRTAGLSRQKIASLLDLSAHFAEGKLSTDQFEHWGDEEIIAHLTQVRGIGRWTAEMFLMFQLQRPDVLPVNDVGINRAIRRQYGLEALPPPAEVLRIGAPWRPWATVACWYLWRSEDTVLLSD